MRKDLQTVVLEGDATKESFVRNVLVGAYSAIDTPLTIDSIELSEVHESTYQILQQHANYDIDISCEIGYDREEQYVDQETKYDRNLGRNVTRNVIKTRTVTDWQPYDTTIRRSGIGYAEAANNDEVDLGDLQSDAAEKHDFFPYDKGKPVVEGEYSSDEEKISSVEFVEPTEYAYSSAVKDGALDACKDIYREIPGDHFRNERVSWSCLYEEPTLCAVNCYKAAFEFDGDTHFAKQFVSESNCRLYSKFEAKDSVLEDIETNRKNDLESNQSMKSAKKIARFSVAGILAGFIVSCAAGNNTIVLAIGIILMVASIILLVRSNKRYNKQSDAIDEKYKAAKNEHLTKMQNQKVELLNERFSSMGFEPLSDEELEKFDIDKAKKLSELL